jgi:prepilin-type N-terminal cleavage/methylation domain-containing protein
MNVTTTKSLRAFTLIELLTVIAIIGILAGIIIPTTGAVRSAAKKAQTKSQFAQWINAFTLYKQEYGYYPVVGTDATDNLISTAPDTEEFVITLTGKNLNGSVLGTTAADIAKLNGNKRRQSFYSFSESELPTGASPLLVDAFGNTQIGVLVDANGDGVIKNGSGSGQDGVLAAVNPAGGGVPFTPSFGSATSDIPTDGVKAGVIFYTAGKDGAAANAVMSWK